MRVLHLLSTRKWTGAAEPVFLLCRELMSRGHQVDLAYSQPLKGKRLSSRKLREGKLSLFAEPSRSLYRPAMKQKAEEMGLSIIDSLRLNVTLNLRDNWNDYHLLRRLIRENRYDIIHCHLAHALYLALICKGLGRKSPKIVYTHHPCKPMRSGFIQRRLVAPRIDQFIFHSPEAAEKCRNDFNLSSERVVFLQGGIDLSPFESSPSGDAYRKKIGVEPDCLLVGMIARMQPRRDHETLIRAIAKLDLPREKVFCLLIGDGEHRIPLENLIQQMNLEDRVLAPGYLQEDYREACAAVDLFTYTAPGSDASCRAVIEAMAMGKPVIGVKRASVPLMIEDGKSGLLFEHKDSAQLASNIQFFLDHPDQIKAFGQHGKVIAHQRLSCQHLAEEVETLYKNLLRFTKISQ